MAISNFNGTTASYFQIGDITIYQGNSPFEYDNLGKDGDIFVADDGTRYSKNNGQWQIQMTEWAGTTIPNDNMGNNGDLYRLISSTGIAGIKYIKVNDSTTDPVGLKWMPITKELYSTVPNDELYSDLDFYETTEHNYVKIDGHWVVADVELTGDTLPPTKMGNNGDVYHNTSNNRFYVKIDGHWIVIDTTYTMTDTPLDTYGITNDIWLKYNNLNVYVKEGSNWTDKNNENKVFGANGLIGDNYFSSDIVFVGKERIYYGFYNGAWTRFNVFYHKSSNPEEYLGIDNDICYNNLKSTYWMKQSGTWIRMNDLGEVQELPVSASDNDLCYIVIPHTSVISDSSAVGDTVDYSTAPRNADGVDGDIYVNTNGSSISSTKYKYNSEWNSISGTYNFNSVPLPVENDNLNNYLYNVNNVNTYICNNRNWNLIGQTITANTAPTFETTNYSIYKTTDTAYIYSNGWIETRIIEYTDIPDDSCGNNYDIYNSEDKKYAKINNEWVDITNNTELSGNADPETTIGDIGDIYTNTTTHQQFIKIEISEWQPVGEKTSYNDVAPSISFYNLNDIYHNINGNYVIKAQSGWVMATSYYSTENVPPASFWSEYDVFETEGGTLYCKYNSTWNEVVGVLLSTNTPDDNMWSVGNIYSSDIDHTYIKVSANEWIEQNRYIQSSNKPETDFWDNGTIYQSPTISYFKSNNIWNNIAGYLDSDNVPNDNNGEDGDVFITSDYKYYIRINGKWKNIQNVLNKNTNPIYNAFGAEKSMFQLANGHRFIKNGGIWNYVYQTLEGNTAPFDDAGDIGTIFQLTPQNDYYVLYSDYSWKPLGNRYNDQSLPDVASGKYLNLYIISENEMYYFNGIAWIQVANIITSHDVPTTEDGSENDLWIVLSSGLYLKDNDTWGKLGNITNSKVDVRKEIYIFS